MVKCEIVSVDCAQFLVGLKRLASRYETASGERLATGYYLAVWPAGACRSSYGRELRYFGPHVTVVAARILQISALSLGIVEPGVDVARPDNDFCQRAEGRAAYSCYCPPLENRPFSKGWLPPVVVFPAPF